MAGLELSSTIIKHTVAKTYSLYLSGGIYDDTQKEFLNDLRIVTEHPVNTTLRLFINSPGGYVHIMNEIIYYIQEYSKKVDVWNCILLVKLVQQLLLSLHNCYHWLVSTMLTQILLS